MGNTKIRRLIKSEGRWTDPYSKTHKHKHDFCIPCNVRVCCNKLGHTHILDYEAMKCDKCQSFVNAVYTGELISSYPTIHLMKSHFALSLKDCKLMKDR